MEKAEGLAEAAKPRALVDDGRGWRRNVAGARSSRLLRHGASPSFYSPSPVRERCAMRRRRTG